MNGVKLVTGCAGFIASKVSEMLLQQGHVVVGVDNLNDYYDVELKNYRLKKLQSNPNFKFYNYDIENKDELDSLFKKYDISVVYNLAARAGVRYSIENPLTYLRTNAEGTLNLLELMKEHKVEKFILASTSSLYAGLEMPFVEELPVNTPISPYAASKKSAEMLAYTYHQLFGIDVSILRYFTVFGPAGRPDMAPLRFVKWINEATPLKVFGDGTQARDFTYVDDIARGTILAEKKLGYEIINLGGGNTPVSINELIKQIEQGLNKKAVVDYLPIHKADMKVTWANIEKAQRLLNWKPEVDVFEGVQKMVNWHVENEHFVKMLNV